jgi:hypothetical protein
VLAVPCVSAASFLAGRPCATRFPWLWQRDAHVDRDQQVLASLDAKPDATVLYSLSHTPGMARLNVHAPALFEGLAARYRIGQVFGPDSAHLIIALAEPRHPAPERVVLRLSDRLDDARAERADGTRVDAHTVAGTATWTLTPRTLWITPGGGGETRLAFPVDVTPGARLRLRAGINPDFWQTLGPFPIRLRVAVETDTGSTELLSVRRDVFANVGDRQWEELDASLERFVGQRVAIVLAATADGWPGGAGNVAGFEDPRIVSPATDAS